MCVDVKYSLLFLPLGILYLLHFFCCLKNKHLPHPRWERKRQPCLVHMLWDIKGILPSTLLSSGVAEDQSGGRGDVSHHLFSLVLPSAPRVSEIEAAWQLIWPPHPWPGPIPRALILSSAPLLGEPWDEAHTLHVSHKALQVAPCAPVGHLLTAPKILSLATPTPESPSPGVVLLCCPIVARALFLALLWASLGMGWSAWKPGLFMSPLGPTATSHSSLSLPESMLSVPPVCEPSVGNAWSVLGRSGRWEVLLAEPTLPWLLSWLYPGCLSSGTHFLSCRHLLLAIPSFFPPSV